MSRIFLILLLVSSAPAYSQTASVDTAFLDQAFEKAKKLYTSSIQGQSRLYSGSEYKDYEEYIKGDANFGSNDWEDGTIQYEDAVYQNVPMMYDIVKDKVVIEHFYSHFKMELAKEKVNSFSLLKHNFVRLEPDKAKAVQSGFYDLLYDGRIKAYAKRQKYIQEWLELRQKKAKFIEVIHFFVQRDDGYFPVKSKSSFIKIFPDQKAALRQYIGKNKIDFHNHLEMAIVLCVEFIDGL